MSERVRLMAGRELDAWVLHLAHGWRWMRRKDNRQCSFFPPEGSEWSRVNFAPSLWDDELLWPSERERFTDWTMGGMKRHDNRVEFLPSPSTDDGAAVRALMTFERFWVRNLPHSGPYEAAVSNRDPSFGPACDGKWLNYDVCLAICGAILSAKGEEFDA